MESEIFSIGNELLAGDITDTNAAWLSSELNRLGLPVAARRTLPDHHKSLAGAFSAALQNSRPLVVTGGLGPTEDDLTRETLAEALGRKLILDEEWLSRLEIQSP